MRDWNDYLEQTNAAIAEIGAASPDIVRAYRTLGEAGHKTGKLDAKTRELIALAVAVTRQCDGCINAHTLAAVKAGASKEELIEALGVAITVNAGAALVYSARARFVQGQAARRVGGLTAAKNNSKRAGGRARDVEHVGRSHNAFWPLIATVVIARRA
jgi:AhpD family alkylhydroperoxidase